MALVLQCLRFFFFFCFIFLHLAFVHSDFSVGKVENTNFDLPELKGLYKPQEAADACDNHATCSGFMYRGLINLTFFPDKQFDTYFFRYIFSIMKGAEYSNWVTYKTKKTFATYQGIFKGSTEVPVQEKAGTYAEICSSRECAGLTVYTHSGIIKNKLVLIDFSLNMFIPRRDIQTLFNFAVVDDGNVKDSSSQVDLCCPKHDKTKDISKFITSVNDTLPRISCGNTSVEDFVKQYVLPRVPVMLTGCIDDWIATKTWTLESLMRRYGEDATWFVQFSYTNESAMAEKLFSHDLSGNQIFELVRMNVKFRIFTRVAQDPNRSSDKDYSKRKPDLLNDWTLPKAIPDDLFKTTLGWSDYQWVIISQPQTGLGLHNDPKMTDAWSALLYGHKYWIIFPKDLEDVATYNCDEECSTQINDYYTVYTVSWYTHVLPQLRQQKWYGGQSIIETVQKPGELLFIPHDYGHTLLNLDETLCITENFLSIAAIDQVALFHANEQKPADFYSEDEARKLWTNLMNRDLKDVRLKKYAREMLKQARNSQLRVP